MTTASIRRVPAGRSHGIDRLAVSVGTALVRWGRVRAARAAVSHDDHARRLEVERTIAAREHAVQRYGIVS